VSGRKSFPLRIPHKLYEDIQKLASRELRSVNGQMEYLLTYALRKINGGKDLRENKEETDSGGKEE